MDRTSPDSRFGDWKFAEEIELKDLQAYPVWIDCMLISMFYGVDDSPIGGDESSSRPVLESANVAPKMKHAQILLKVENNDHSAVGVYNCDAETLTCIVVYDQHGVRVDQRLLDVPLGFVAVPTIDGVKGIRFNGNPDDSESAVQENAG